MVKLALELPPVGPVCDGHKEFFAATAWGFRTKRRSTFISEISDPRRLDFLWPQGLLYMNIYPCNMEVLYSVFLELIYLACVIWTFSLAPAAIHRDERRDKQPGRWSFALSCKRIDMNCLLSSHMNIQALVGDPTRCCTSHHGRCDVGMLVFTEH
jgi:hypothetical protein